MMSVGIPLSLQCAGGLLSSCDVRFVFVVNGLLSRLDVQRTPLLLWMGASLKLGQRSPLEFLQGTWNSS